MFDKTPSCPKCGRIDYGWHESPWGGGKRHWWSNSPNSPDRISISIDGKKVIDLYGVIQVKDVAVLSGGKRIDKPTMRRCPLCKGKGKHPDFMTQFIRELTPCVNCHGAGYIQVLKECVED